MSKTNYSMKIEGNLDGKPFVWEIKVSISPEDAMKWGELQAKQLNVQNYKITLKEV